MNGSGAQTITFSFPGGAGSSHFQDLEIANTSGSVTLVNSAFVNGSLIAQAGSIKSLIGGGSTLTVNGLDVDGLSLDNVLLVVQPGNLSKFNNVRFSSYSAT